MTDHKKDLRRLRLRRFALVVATLLGGAVLIVVTSLILSAIGANPTCPGK